MSHPSTLQQTPSVAVAPTCTTQYRARNPRATPLYRLFDAHFDEVKGQLEERFERRFGFWRGFVDEQVRRYLDCGLFENEQVNRILVEAAISAGIDRGRKVRVDSTVSETNIHPPSDSWLLFDCVRVVTRPSFDKGGFEQSVPPN